MPLTGNQLMVQFSQFLDDYWTGTTTAGGAADGTTVIDDALKRFGDKGLEEAYVRVLTDSAVAGNINTVRRITSAVTNTLTVSPGFPQAVATSKSYEVHRYDPDKKFVALDRARILAFPQVAKIIEDETVTSDGLSTEIVVPASIRRGPAQVWVEMPIPPSVRWNILPDYCETKLTATTGWAATSVTATVVARTQHDLIIPRVEEQCIKLTSGLSGSLGVALGAVAAAKYAGRRMSFGVWVYSRSALPTVSITDDAGTSTSTAHTGFGWQFLQVSRDISGTNATTLTVKINPLTNNQVYVERAYFGDTHYISQEYTEGPIPRKGVWRDDSHSVLMLQRPAPRGFQYRLVGRTPVTALGTDRTTQTTNSMEVSEADQDLLLATAARILLTWEGMSTGEIDQSMPQIQVVEARFKEMQEDWKRRYPRSGFIEGWG